MDTAAFERFLRRYYRERILELARGYPEEGKSLVVHWDDLYQFDPALADDLRERPQRTLAAANEALRTFDVPVDVDLDGASIQLAGYRRSTPIRDLRAEHVNTLVAVRGLVRKATPVRPKIEVAVYECLTCAGEIEIVQRGQELRAPNRCPHCERNTQFERLDDRSLFIDSQRLRVQESPEGLRGGDMPENIDIHLEEDLTGVVSPGDRVTVTGILRLKEQTSGGVTSPILDVFLEGIHVEIEEEEFEVMEIEDEDIEEIQALAEHDDVYERVVNSIAPSIWGYDDEKFAMALQLFSGVRKHLPDGSRVRGDIHILLVGDPGTGKCVTGDTQITLDQGRNEPIREIVERHLTDPTPIDDGVYQEVKIPLPSLYSDGRIRSAIATKVWKREAPSTLFRITTEGGRAIEMTPSHPLFVQSAEGYVPTPVRDLDRGDVIATAPRQTIQLVPDGGSEQVTEERIERVDEIEPTEDWVYDLEVAGTHNYVSNGVISHNSQLLQYITKISPRSVYTSGKGSSAAGLCVTGDTQIQTPAGSIPIKELVACEIPEPVSADTAAPVSREVYTCDPTRETIEVGHASAVWRMPPKPCHRIETNSGKTLTASSNTPLLVNDGEGVRWRQIDQLDHGDTIAISAEGNDSNAIAIERDGLVALQQTASRLRWDRVSEVTAIGEREVYDLTVDRTHNFLGNGIVTHNTAAAVRDDFGDGTQWSLEAGALVLADQGVAAVDELDKMRCVTGDTVVHMADGSRRSIASLAKAAVQDGEIDALPNGRTVRNVDYDVLSMTDSGEIESREVVAIHEYNPPETLVRVELASGKTIRATLDHPFFVVDNDEITQADCADLRVGDLAVVSANESLATDGGLQFDESVDIGPDVTVDTIVSVHRLENETDRVYDLTVAGTHNFVANGMVVHNSEDRSAMHEALEQQSVSVSKAGINATLQARCALLGAANPKYGRFDQYEPIPEQIELEPALISRFDLIFTVDDLPDADRDERIADHILTTNYAGELRSRQAIEVADGGLVAELEEVTEAVTPVIEPALLRKYVAYATQRVVPTMTPEAREVIREFYLDLRAQGIDDDSPVPITARKLEALVRLAEASARIRLADEVTAEDAERVIELVRTSMSHIGLDPESGEYDIDMIETGTPKTQRDRIRSLKQLMERLEEEYDEGIPLEVIIEEADDRGMDPSRVEHELQKMKQTGEIYEPSQDRFRLA